MTNSHVIITGDFGAPATTQKRDLVSVHFASLRPTMGVGLTYQMVAVGLITGRSICRVMPAPLRPRHLERFAQDVVIGMDTLGVCVDCVYSEAGAPWSHAAFQSELEFLGVTHVESPEPLDEAVQLSDELQSELWQRVLRDETCGSVDDMQTLVDIYLVDRNLGEEGPRHLGRDLEAELRKLAC